MIKYSIVSISAEVAPFSKTGGLGDVTRSLPKSLKRLGHDVTVITPLYKKVIDVKHYGLKKVLHNIPLQIGDTTLTVSYYRGELMHRLPVYFVSADDFFGTSKRIYGHSNDNQRFFVFNAAALKLIELLNIHPNIIHCHDWHTGLVPELLKKEYKSHPVLSSAATVFTIHNLTFQLGHNWWEIPGEFRDRGIKPLPSFNDPALEHINFTKRAILQADVVNAVSETYAQEILGRNFGQDLHRILKNRQHKLFGVVNGIDYNEFNPGKDPNLTLNYTYTKTHRKQINKIALQQRYPLSPDPTACVLVMTSRIAEQKGFDILLPVISNLMQLNLQLIIMGDGNQDYIKQIKKLAKLHPHTISITPFKEHDETMLYAGGDMSLFPSRFEPCGTGQLKSLRYGCIPVVRKIGGLGDTITDYDKDHLQGNGFVFRHYTEQEVLSAITRAYGHFQRRKEWRTLVVRGMKQSNSWELPARRYVLLYEQALRAAYEQRNLD